MQQLNTAGALFMVVSILGFVSAGLGLATRDPFVVTAFAGALFSAALALFFFGLSDIARRIIILLVEQRELLKSVTGKASAATTADSDGAPDRAWLVKPKTKS